MNRAFLFISHSGTQANGSLFRTCASSITAGAIRGERWITSWLLTFTVQSKTHDASAQFLLTWAGYMATVGGRKYNLPCALKVREPQILVDSINSYHTRLSECQSSPTDGTGTKESPKGIYSWYCPLQESRVCDLYRKCEKTKYNHFLLIVSSGNRKCYETAPYCHTSPSWTLLQGETSKCNSRGCLAGSWQWS